MASSATLAPKLEVAEKQMLFAPWFRHRTTCRVEFSVPAFGSKCCLGRVSSHRNMLIAQRQFSAIGELVLSDKKGHIVVQALQTLGQTQVWCTVIEHLDEYERALLHVALNRLAETGDWEVEV